MKKLNNIEDVANVLLCTGCGICQSACPVKSISIKVQNGQIVPIVDSSKCLSGKGCHRCLDSCPGVGINISELAKNCFHESALHSDLYLGKYMQCYTGYSTDYDNRFHCASGGMLTQLLIFLLEKKYIDGALVTSFDPSNKLLVKSFLAKTKQDIIKARSSKYSPVTLNNAISDIKNDIGQKFVIVGLPCHIHGFRKYEELDSKFKEKIAGYFGLYCSGGRTFHLTDYVFKEFGIDRNGLEYLSYRDDGCLGYMVAKGTCPATKETFLIKKRYQDYYHPLRSIFIPRRCLFCVDHFAELADVSFGDIHVEPYMQDKVGINSFVVRNAQFFKWIKEAAEAGCIKIDELEKEKLLKSQTAVYQKKRRIATFLKLEKMRKRRVPQYDIDFKDSSFFKSSIAYAHTLMQLFIGRHKSLWFIIKYLKKDSKDLC
jgi:coenzyme F420 hydrogenase subunit beta